MYLDWMTWIERNCMGCDMMNRLLAKTAAMALNWMELKFGLKMEHDGI